VRTTIIYFAARSSVFFGESAILLPELLIIYFVGKSSYFVGRLNTSQSQMTQIAPNIQKYLRDLQIRE
jgi:hypothetical protein